MVLDGQVKFELAILVDDKQSPRSELCLQLGSQGFPMFSLMTADGRAVEV